MSLSYISQELRRYFEDNFNSCPYVFENQGGFQTPKLWVRMSILSATPLGITLGRKGCYIERGIVDFQVFESIDGGTFESESILDEIATLFKQENINNIKTKLPSFTKLGIVDNYNQSNLSIDYEYYQKD
jgi:uncharacterized protein (DUF2344 family)